MRPIPYEDSYGYRYPADLPVCPSHQDDETVSDSDGSEDEEELDDNLFNADSDSDEINLPENKLLKK